MPDFKFPDPKDVPPKHPVVICPGERVLALYNQNTGENAKRISKGVREWFQDEASRNGWSGTHFLPEVQSMHGAGCLLTARGTQEVTDITNAALNLVDTKPTDE
jgi:hypothetical protein